MKRIGRKHILVAAALALAATAAAAELPAALVERYLAVKRDGLL